METLYSLNIKNLNEDDKNTINLINELRRFPSTYGHLSFKEIYESLDKEKNKDFYLKVINIIKTFPNENLLEIFKGHKIKINWSYNGADYIQELFYYLNLIFNHISTPMFYNFINKNIHNLNASLFIEFCLYAYDNHDLSFHEIKDCLVFNSDYPNFAVLYALNEFLKLKGKRK